MIEEQIPSGEILTGFAPYYDTERVQPEYREAFHRVGDMDFFNGDVCDRVEGLMTPKGVLRPCLKGIAVVEYDSRNPLRILRVLGRMEIDAVQGLQ